MTSTPSWKKYGSTKTAAPNGKYDNLVVNRLSLLSEYVGNFTISGLLTVDGGVAFLGPSTISGSMTINDNLLVKNNIRATNLDLSNNLVVAGQSTQRGAMTIGSGTQFLHGDASGITINKLTSPGGAVSAATLDVTGTRSESLSLYTSAATNRNILAQNNTTNGVVVSTSTEETMMELYHGPGQSVAVDLPAVTGSDASIGARIAYSGTNAATGLDTLTVTASNMLLQGCTAVTNRDQAVLAAPTFEARVRDLSSSNSAANIEYLPDSSTLVSGVYSGIGVAVKGASVASNAFLSATNADGSRGVLIGGGQAVGRPGYSMGTLGFQVQGAGKVFGDAASTVQPLYVPALSVVQGTSGTSLRTTLGVNTSTPAYDDVVLDVNGPARFRHREVVATSLNVPTTFSAPSMSFSPVAPLNGILVGAASGTTGGGAPEYTAYYTSDGGQSWVASTGIVNSTFENLRVYFGGSQTAIVFAKANSTFVTVDGGQTWVAKNIMVPTDNTLEPVTYVVSGTTRLYYAYVATVFLNADYTTNNMGTPLIAALPFTVSGIHGAVYSGTERVYLCGSNYLVTKTNAAVPVTVQQPQAAYYSVIRCDSTGQTCIAAGVSALDQSVLVSYTTVGGSTWSTVVTNDHIGFEPRAVCIIDARRAVLVGTVGMFLYSSDGYQTWTALTSEEIGVESAAVLDPNAILTDVFLADDSGHAFVVSAVRGGRTTVYVITLPGLMDDVVLVDVDGSQRIRQNIEVGGDMSVGGDAVVSGDIACGGNTSLAGTLSVNGAVAIDGDTTVSGVTTLSGDTSIRGEVVSLVGTVSTAIGGGDTVTLNSAANGVVNIGTNLSPKTVNIGSSNSDTIVLQGNVVIVNNPVVTEKSILLNNGNVAPNSGGNVGLYVYEQNGGVVNTAAGYMLTTTDRGGIKFKAPASDTVLKLTLDGLSLGTGSSPLMTLVPGSSDVSYNLVSSNIDSTNVLLRVGAQSSAVAQTIATDVIIRGALTVSGATSISGTSVSLSGDTSQVLGTSMSIVGRTALTLSGGSVSVSGTSLSLSGVSTVGIAAGSALTLSGASVGVQGTAVSISGSTSISLVGNVLTLSGTTLTATSSAATVTGTTSATVSGATVLMRGVAVTVSGSTITLSGVSSVYGPLTVSGNISGGGTLFIPGLATLGTLSVSGLATLGTLSVSGLATLGTLSVSGATTVGETLDVSGLATLGTLSVSGATTVGETLDVSGNITGGGTLMVPGIITAGSMSVFGQINGGGALSITGASSLATLFVPGVANVSGATNLSGALNVSGLTKTAALNAAGDISGAGNLNVSGTATLATLSVQGVSNMSGTTNLSGALNVSGLSKFAALNAAGNISGALNLNISGIATLASLVVPGTAGVSGALNVSGLSKVTALNAAGDISGAMNLNISGVATLATLTVPGAVGVSGALSVSGLSKVAALNATGNISGSLNLNISGTATLATLVVPGTLNVSGVTKVESVNVSGALNVSGLSTVASLSVLGQIGSTGNTVGIITPVVSRYMYIRNSDIQPLTLYGSSGCIGALGANFSSGDGEMNFINCSAFLGDFTAFTWDLATSTTTRTKLMSLSASGNVAAIGNVVSPNINNIQEAVVGAYMVDIVISGGNQLYPIMCSVPIFLPSGKDDRYIVMPGYKVEVYTSPNYVNLVQTVDNTLGTTIMSIETITQNTMQSVRLYFKNVEKTILGVS